MRDFSRRGWPAAIALAGMMFASPAVADVGAPGAAPIDPARLYLRAGEIDTSVPRRDLHTQIGAHDPGARFVIQLDGPMTPARRERLNAAGIAVGPYLPSNAYIVVLDGADPVAVQALDFIRWYSTYQDDWKLDPDLGARPYNTPERQAMAARGRDYIVIVTFPGVNAAAVQQAVSGIRGTKVISTQMAGSARLGTASTEIYVEMNIRDAAALAAIPGVQFVEPAADIDIRMARNDNSRWVIQRNQTGVFPLYQAGLFGQGQIVGILDTAVRQDHCSFHDPANPVGPNHRKIVGYNTAFGSASHGTHVAASIVGDAGQETGHTRGVAYQGRLAYNSWGSAPFDDIALRLGTHHAQGARVHSNSWGDDGTTAYNVLCRGIDLFQWENEDSLTLWAVTNTSTLRNPENAKNLLAVGATRIAPQQHLHGYGGAGPTSDGRRKPEVYAPGRDTMSASSSTTCGVTSMGGTSMACPVAAGVAMLTRQYFVDGFYPLGVASPGAGFEPSAALVKAMLINSAVDLTGEPGYPSNREGWGRLRADDSLYLDGDARKLNVHDVRNAEGLSTSGTAEYIIPVTGSDEPLRMTLVWTEPPATAGAALAVVNDLDLQVTDPLGQLYRGNVFDTGAGFSVVGGTRDDRNNVEQVHIANPLTGLWTVRISAAAVNQALQGYALVVTGEIMPAEPPPLILSMAEPVPFFVPPGQPRQLQVRIIEGSRTLVPGSPRMHYRTAPGPFTSVTLAHSGGPIHVATLPGFSCGDQPEFYFTAVADDNTTVLLPSGAPVTLLGTQVGGLEVVTVLATDFEASLPAGWSVSGLWNLTSGCAPPGTPCHPAPWAYYGNVSTCTYNTGSGSNSGSLTSPMIALPPAAPGGELSLSFCHALVTENNANFDLATLRVNGAQAMRLGEASSWQGQQVDLSAFGGQNVNLSWHFDTVDGFFNDHRGWHVDNIRITASIVTCQQACYANCDGSTTAPVLNIDDFTCYINRFAEAQLLPHEEQISHYANCDGSTTAPVLNIDDFSCFINRFALGCP